MRVAAGNYESSSFPPDVTPLMLAAHRDNYEIIKILLDKGARIPQVSSMKDTRDNILEWNNT